MWKHHINLRLQSFESAELQKEQRLRVCGYLKEKVGNEIGSLIGENDKAALVAGMVGLTVHESVGNDRVSIQPFQGWALLLREESSFRQTKYAKISTPATPAHRDSSRSTAGHTSEARKQRRPKH